MLHVVRLAAICGSVAVLGGCGASDTAGDAAKEVEKAVDPVAEAAQKTAAQGGARMIGDLKMSYAGTPLTMTINGEISFDDSRMRMRMNLGQIKGVSASEMAAARREAEMPIDYVQTPGEIFISTGKVREKGRQKGFEWIRLDLEELDEEAGLDLQRANQFSEVNPEATLRFLRTMGDARKTGTATIRGQRTDRYEGTIDLRRYPEMVPEKDRESAQRTADLMVRSWGGPTMRLSVFINEQGLIVRERMPMSFTDAGEKVKALMVLDMVDLGSPQEIEVPDEDEALDVTDQAAKDSRFANP